MKRTFWYPGHRYVLSLWKDVCDWDHDAAICDTLLPCASSSHTSVLVAAFRSRHGASRMLLDMFYAGKFEALASQALFLEYRDVLYRPEQMAAHQFPEERLTGLLRDLADRMTPVEIYFRYRPQLRDPDDELVLEAALNGAAEAIVTHNVRDFLPAASLYGIEILTPGRIIKERFRS